MEDKKPALDQTDSPNSEGPEVFSTKECKAVSTKNPALIPAAIFGIVFVVFLIASIVVIVNSANDLVTTMDDFVLRAFATFLIGTLLFALYVRTAEGEANQEENVITMTKKDAEFLIVESLPKPVDGICENPSKAVAQDVLEEKVAVTDETEPSNASSLDEPIANSVEPVGSISVDTLADLSKAIDVFFSKKGAANGFGAKLISSMILSRCVVLYGDEGFENEAERISTLFGTQKFVIDANRYEEEKIEEEYLLAQAFKAAEQVSDVPVFIYLQNVTSRCFATYFEGLFDYIKNPGEDLAITCCGSALNVPKNVWFIVCLEKKSVPFDIGKKLLPYVAVIHFEYEKQNSIDENCTQISCSLAQIRSLLPREYGKNFLSEEKWKLFDSFIALFHTANEYKVDNRMATRFENSISALLAINHDENAALDIALSSSLLISAISLSSPEKFEERSDLTNFFDGTFGNDQMPLCRKAVREYFALFDNEGNRIYE